MTVPIPPWIVERLKPELALEQQDGQPKQYNDQILHMRHGEAAFVGWFANLPGVLAEVVGCVVKDNRVIAIKVAFYDTLEYIDLI